MHTFSLNGSWSLLNFCGVFFVKWIFEAFQIERYYLILRLHINLNKASILRKSWLIILTGLFIKLPIKRIILISIKIFSLFEDWLLLILKVNFIIIILSQTHIAYFYITSIPLKLFWIWIKLILLFLGIIRHLFRWLSQILIILWLIKILFRSIILLRRFLILKPQSILHSISFSWSDLLRVIMMCWSLICSLFMRTISTFLSWCFQSEHC